MSKKHFLVFLGAIFILLVVIGCGDKETGISGVAMYDDGEAPAIPQGLQVQSVYLFTNPTLDYNKKRYKTILRWNKVSTNIKGASKDNIIGYKIYRNDTSKPLGIVDKDTLIYEDNSTDLKEGKTYAYYVAAFDSLLRETRSDAERIRITPTAAAGHMPDRPLNVILVRESNNSVTLVWDEPENISEIQTNNDAIDSYIIYKKIGETGSYEIVARVSADAFFFNDPTVVESTRYYYKVRAVTESGLLGIESEEQSIVIQYDANDDGYPPAAPEWPSSNAITEITYDGNANARKLTWNAPPYNDNGTSGQESAGDVLGYKIYRSVDSSSDVDNSSFNPSQVPYRLVAIVNNQTNWTDASNLDSSNNPVDYYYRVAAFDYSGNTGDMTQPMKLNGAVLPVPTNFQAQIDNYDYVQLEWDSVGGAYTYNIYESRNGNTYKLLMGDVATTSYEPRKLTDDKNYFYKIASYNSTTQMESNKTYFIRLSKYDSTAGGQNVIQMEGESLISAVQIRNILDATGNWSNSWGNLSSNQYQLRSSSLSAGGESIQVLHFDCHGASEGYTYNTSYWWNSDGSSIVSGSQAGALSFRTDRAYMDQFRIMWMPETTGKYTVRVDYVQTNNSGIWWVLLRNQAGVLGQGFELNAYSPNNYADYFEWPSITVQQFDPVYIAFSGAYYGNAIQTSHSIFIDKITITRTD